MSKSKGSLGSDDVGINQYAQSARVTADYPKLAVPGMWGGQMEAAGAVYPALKLCGEAGEVAEHIGKLFRDDGGVITPNRRHALIKELGDVAWYWVNLCIELDVNPADVLRLNIIKLRDRAERNQIHGEGDDR